MHCVLSPESEISSTIFTRDLLLKKYNLIIYYYKIVYLYYFVTVATSADLECSVNVDVYVLAEMGTFVTLAEVLEARGSPLDEDEVWCLLLASTEALLDISKKGNQEQHTNLYFFTDPLVTWLQGLVQRCVQEHHNIIGLKCATSNICIHMTHVYLLFNPQSTLTLFSFNTYII